MSRNQYNANSRSHSKGFVLLTCTVVLFLCLVLFITQLLRYIEAKDNAKNKPDQESESVLLLEASGNQQGEIKTYLSATSTEEDLYIVVRTEGGYAIEGESFSIDVTYPSGNIFTYTSDPDGSCYLGGLPGGEYRVSMAAQNGYLAPESLLISVKEHSNHFVLPDGTSILDENGNVTFSYRFGTDENGYLLYKKTGKPSDVVLVNDRQSGEVYGLRFISPSRFLHDESSALHTERVELIYPDNTVNVIYDIEAAPNVRSEGQQAGWQLVDGQTCFVDGHGRKLTGYRRIDGKKYFFDDNGIKAKSLGVDVSSYNDSINWEAAKAQGIDFAILRAGGRGWTSGRTYNDSFLYAYMQGAKKAGLKIGLYFYSTAITPEEAVEEANFILQRLDHIPLEMPIYFDSEYSGEYPDGRADLLTISQRTNLARAFCETIEMAGYKAGVYASQNFFGTTLDYLPVSQYSIWLANYTRDLSLPTFYYDYDIWQFTESGTVNGFSGGVDMNVIFSD